MSISQNFPDEGPSLILNFAGSKTIDPRITFTRSSVGTYMNKNGLIVTAPADSPRFDHSVVGVGTTVTGVESLGLLIEGQRTNLLIYSEQIDNAAWSKTNVGVTTNFAVAPDGTTTAEEIFPTTVGSQLRNISQSYTISTAQSYTFSIFVKKHTLTSNFLAIRISNHTATADIYSNFNFSTETFGVASTTAGWTGNTSVQKLLNGWYRLSITANTIASTHTILQVNVWGGGYQGTTETIGNYLIWGAQLETGPFASSYIPTVASTVTRSIDRATIEGNNFNNIVNQNEGTVYSNCQTLQIAPNQQYAGLMWGIGDRTSFNESIYIGFSTSGDFSPTSFGLSVIDNGSAVFQSSGFSTSRTPVKVAFGYKTNDTAMSSNGSSPTTDTSISLPTTNIIRLGNASWGELNPLNGHISQFIYYPKRLTNTQLQNLTR
jgi:hypothetical protein